MRPRARRGSPAAAIRRSVFVLGLVLSWGTVGPLTGTTVAADAAFDPHATPTDADELKPIPQSIISRWSDEGLAFVALTRPLAAGSTAAAAAAGAAATTAGIRMRAEADPQEQQQQQLPWANKPVFRSTLIVAADGSMYAFKRLPPKQQDASEAVMPTVDASPAAQRIATAGLLGVAGSNSNSNSSSSSNRRLQIVLGTDSRREVLEVPSYPLSAQGYLQFGFIDSTTGLERRQTCTAGLVGPAVILTAAHCFYSRQLRVFHVNAMFNPGRWRGGRSQAWANITRGFIHRAFITSRDASGAAQHDIALLVLDAPLGLAAGFLGLCTARSGVAAGLAMAGYPTDKAAGSLWYTPPAACRVRSRGDDSLLSHTCDTSTGMSGTNMFQQLVLKASDAAADGNSTGGMTCVWGEPPAAQIPGGTESDSPIPSAEAGASSGSNGANDSAVDPRGGSSAEGPGSGGVSGGDAVDEPAGGEAELGWFVRAVHGSGSEAGGENLGVKINSRWFRWISRLRWTAAG